MQPAATHNFGTESLQMGSHISRKAVLGQSVRCGSFQAIPEQVQEPGAGQDGCNIEQDSGAVSQKPGDVAKDNLPHRIVRADVEHIDLPVRMEQEVERRCDQAAGKKHADTLFKAGP